MCIAVIQSLVKPKIGYKIVERNYKDKLVTPYQYKPLILGEWSFISKIQYQYIPDWIKSKGTYSKDNLVDNPYSKMYAHFDSKDRNYVLGFHLLPNLRVAKEYMKMTTYEGNISRTHILKCEYIGKLAEGYDYSSHKTLDAKIRTIVAMAIKPVEIVS